MKHNISSSVLQSGNVILGVLHSENTHFKSILVRTVNALLLCIFITNNMNLSLTLTVTQLFEDEGGTKKNVLAVQVRTELVLTMIGIHEHTHTHVYNKHSLEFSRDQTKVLQATKSLTACVCVLSCVCVCV